jgi:signal transduction histidine kinase
MNFIRFRILVFIALSVSFSKAYSQNIETLKVALTHKVANCVVWRADTSTFFTIGVLSNNQEIVNKFKELAKITKISNKSIRIIVFDGISSLKPVHLLYVDNKFNTSLASINFFISQQNTLLVTEECNKPGEIMVNLRVDTKNQKLSFEYNRANILFAGLELTEQIVYLKGSEIEIRELYLQAKKLWDEQKRKADSLEVQTEIQEKDLKIHVDSVALVKELMEENAATIQKQNQIIAAKDSFSSKLNNEIQSQKTEISGNRKELVQFMTERDLYVKQVSEYQHEVTSQKKLSDSLAVNIIEKKNELAERTKTLGEKETIINKQSDWLLFLVSVISVICILIFFILKAYLSNKKANKKIADQKEELETILERLQNTQEQLIQSEKMASLGVLVAGIAHEINNPVNFISSGISGIEKVVNKLLVLLNELNKLKEDCTTSEIKQLVELKNKLDTQKYVVMMPEIIENIKFGINRTISIIDGLRLYSHADIEAKIMNDINQIIDSSVLLIKPKIKDRVEIITNYENLPQISVFPAKLSQVFVNIISNAVDAVLENESNTEKSIIKINTKKQNNHIVIEISDTGKGIPSEITTKIFDPFFTTKKVGKGTGLGLSISYGIIAEHNGHIFAKNNKNKGATFTIELPIPD